MKLKRHTYVMHPYGVFSRDTWNVDLPERLSVNELIFVGRTDDNEQIILMDEDGQEFQLAIDDHLVRSVTTITKPSNETSIALGVSPRDIQTRIRRGESVTQIALESGVADERIARYAGPVLAERKHMANRAQQTFLRRQIADVTLFEAVMAQLSDRDADSLEYSWDSWRREDSRWTVTINWQIGSGNGLATWIFDPLSQTILAIDEEARWLIQDETAPVTKSEEVRPRLVGLPASIPDEVSQDLEELEPPAWAGPGHPTMPVPISVPNQNTDAPSWDDILFGNKPSD